MLLTIIPTLLIAGYFISAGYPFFSILFSIAFLSIMGFVDDLRGLTPWTRFAGQTFVALLMVSVGIRLEIVYFPTELNIALTIIWIVGITNALNIIDIMDGLAGGVALIAGAVFLFVALPAPQPEILILSATLIGAVGGFLVHNYSGKIYMGDSGSYLLGFMLSIIAIREQFTAENSLALLSPVLILGIPIYDTFLVMILRIRKRKNPFHGSRDHFALRLEVLGIPRKYVVIMIWLISVTLGQAAFIMTRLNIWGAAFAYILIAIVACTVAKKISMVDM